MADVAGLVTKDSLATVKVHAARVVGRHLSIVGEFAHKQRPAVVMGCVVLLACLLAKTYGLGMGLGLVHMTSA